MRKPKVAITSGDPAGIGPEISERAAADESVRDVCEPVLFGPPSEQRFRAGSLSAEAGRAAYDVIVRAVEAARSGVVDAIATAPVNKEAFRLAGLPWSGHTDLLAHLTGSPHVAMMFDSEPLRVVLATIHIPLAAVPTALTRASLEATIDLTAKEMPRFGIGRPRIAVAGLNPHAGEHGLFGDEEQRVMTPAIDACRARGIDVTGPFPGDTIFVRAAQRRIRRRRGLLPRSRAHSREAPGVWARGKRHARLADHQNVSRPRHGIRYRRQRPWLMPVA